MDTKKTPLIRVENTNYDKFISNGFKSLYMFPNPTTHSSKSQSYWISIYNYKDEIVINQRIVSSLTLEILINTIFYN